MNSEKNSIGGIPILELKKLALKYLQKDDYDSMQKVALKISIAQAARLSYLNHSNEIDYEKDIKLHDQLLEFKHFSPFEHVARCMSDLEYSEFVKGRCYREPENVDYIEIPKEAEGWCNNFRGFIQYRYIVENEK